MTGNPVFFCQCRKKRIPGIGIFCKNHRCPPASVIQLTISANSVEETKRFPSSIKTMLPEIPPSCSFYVFPAITRHGQSQDRKIPVLAPFRRYSCTISTSVVFPVALFLCNTVMFRENVISYRRWADCIRNVCVPFTTRTSPPPESAHPCCEQFHRY